MCENGKSVCHVQVCLKKIIIHMYSRGEWKVEGCGNGGVVISSGNARVCNYVQGREIPVYIQREGRREEQREGGGREGRGREGGREGERKRRGIIIYN